MFNKFKDLKNIKFSRGDPTNNSIQDLKKSISSRKKPSNSLPQKPSQEFAEILFHDDDDETITLNHTSSSSDIKNTSEKSKSKDQRIRLGYELLYYCSKGEINSVEHALSRGRDVNIIDENHNTGLHYACASEKILCVKEMMKQVDINVNIKNEYGNTPLMIACKEGNEKIIKMLLKKGAKYKDMFNNDGYVANDFCNEKCQKVFDEYEMNENMFIKDGVEKRNMKKVKELYNKVNVNCICFDDDGDGDGGGEMKENALKISVKKKNNMKMIEFLINVAGIQCNQDDIKDSRKEYQEFLQNKLMEKRRQRIILEILSTEKAYFEDLRLLIELFPDSKEMYNLVSDEKYRNDILNLFEMIFDIRNTNLQFLQGLMALSPFKDNHEEVVKLFEQVNFSYYLNYIPRQAIIVDLLKTEKELKKLEQHFQILEKRIPKYKIQQFVSFLDKPRVRIIKYRDLISRLLKHVDEIEDHNLFSTIKRVKLQIEENIVKIDAETGEVKDDKELVIFDKYMKKYSNTKKYNSSMFFECSNRKYLTHILKVPSFDLISTKSKILDVYVFNDCIFFGDENDFEFHSVHEKKFVFVFDYKFIKIAIYHNQKLISEYMLFFDFTKKWLKMIKSVDRYNIYTITLYDEKNTIDEFIESKFERIDKKKVQEMIKKREEERLNEIEKRINKREEQLKMEESVLKKREYDVKKREEKVGMLEEKERKRKLVKRVKKLQIEKIKKIQKQERQDWKEFLKQLKYILVIYTKKANSLKNIKDINRKREDITTLNKIEVEFNNLLQESKKFKLVKNDKTELDKVEKLFNMMKIRKDSLFMK